MELLTLKSGHRTVEVKLSDITHIEAMDNYVKIYRSNLPLVITQTTMKEMEQRLPADKFRRVHRSFIIALDQIEAFAYRVISCKQPNLRIPVGRKYLTDFTQYYRNLKASQANSESTNENGPE